MVKRMKRIGSIYFLFGFLLVGLSTQAQNTAREVLDQVSTHLLSFKTLQADFSFTLQNIEADIEDSHNGTLVIQGDKFRLKLMGMLVQCDGTTMWNYMEEMNEASILDPEESDLFNPKNIFTLYKEDFAITTLAKSGSIHDIELVPTAAYEDYERIVIRIDYSKKLIREVTYDGTDGNQYIIKITNMIPDISADDRFFIFDASKYPGVEVFDMR